METSVKLLVGLLVLILPAPALARDNFRHHGNKSAAVFSQPTTVAPVVVSPTPQTTGGGQQINTGENIGNPTVPGNVGCTRAINYGYQPLVNGQYDMNQVSADLARLKKAGYQCLRLAFYGTNAGVTKALALDAKNAGFYVEIGNDGNPNSSGYASGVIAEAGWAQSNGIDQLSIGNEASKDAQTQSALATLSCQVRSVFHGTISYDTYLDPKFDEIKAWAQNRGCLDRLGLNLYADYANTLNEAQSLLGSSGYYVSETDVDCDANLCSNDSSWASGLQSVLNIETPYHVPIFIFSYNAGGDSVDSHWGIAGHKAVESVIGL